MERNLKIGERIEKITFGHDFAIAETNKSGLYVLGSNQYGQIGLGNGNETRILMKISGQFGYIRNIACGKTHCAILDSHGVLYTSGNNSDYQIGVLYDNEFESRNIFTKIESNDEYVEVDCNSFGTLVLNTKGDVFYIGLNKDNILNEDDYDINEDNYHYLKKVDIGKKVKHIAMNDSRIYIQDEDDYVYSIDGIRNKEKVKINSLFANDKVFILELENGKYRMNYLLDSNLKYNKGNSKLVKEFGLPLFISRDWNNLNNKAVHKLLNEYIDIH